MELDDESKGDVGGGMTNGAKKILQLGRPRDCPICTTCHLKLKWLLQAALLEYEAQVVYQLIPSRITESSNDIRLCLLAGMSMHRHTDVN